MAHKHIGAVICLLNISAKCIKEYMVCLQLVMLCGVNGLFTAVRGRQTCGTTKANPVSVCCGTASASGRRNCFLSRLCSWAVTAARRCVK